MTKSLILDKLWRDPLIDDILYNITGGNALREDLKSELFLILMEMKDQKIIKAWKEKWIHYLCVNILKKQWKSSTSPFYKKFKGEKSNDFSGDIIDELDDFDYELLDKVLQIVETKLPLVERELFMMRYKLGKYDRWLGVLRDKECQKAVYSYRKIEQKLAITMVDGGQPITIDHSTVEKYHKRSIQKIKKLLGNDTK